MAKVVVAGATGLIGTALVNALLARNDKIVVVSRSPHSKVPVHPNLRSVVWDPENETRVVHEVDGADAVVNLAGEPIAGKRWSGRQKQRILTSRVSATHTIARSIQAARQRPSVLVNASAVGYYGPHGNEELTEESKAGQGYLAETCKAWEAHAIRIQDFGVRVVRLRTGIVLDSKGGALKMMLPPFRMGFGGWLGDGNQWMSWIHLEDMVSMILFSLDQPKTTDAVNATAPQPVTNKAFSMVLAQTLKRPCFAPVPAFVLKLILGEMSELLLTGQRVVPRKSQELGFVFRHPDIRGALQALLS